MSAKVRKAPSPQRVMDCPVPSCTSGPGKGRQRGAVSGIKKHVGIAHPEQYEKIKDMFPPARGLGGLEEMSIRMLRQVAMVSRIPAYKNMTKDELIRSIEKMPTGRKGDES